MPSPVRKRPAATQPPTANDGRASRVSSTGKRSRWDHPPAATGGSSSNQIDLTKSNGQDLEADSLTDKLDVGACKNKVLRDFITNHGGKTVGLTERHELQEKAYEIQHRQRMLEPVPQQPKKGTPKPKPTPKSHQAWTNATLRECLCHSRNGSSGARGGFVRGPRFEDCTDAPFQVEKSAADYKDEHGLPATVWVKPGCSAPPHKSDGWRAVVMLAKLCTSTLGQGVFQFSSREELAMINIW